MTVAERFAKYSTQEIVDGIARLERKIDEAAAAMKTFKAEKNVEFFNGAKDLYEDYCEKLLDAKIALESRL